MHEAARLGDPVEHTDALAGLLVGAAVGLVAGAVIGALVVGTGGLAAGIFIAGAACLGTAVGGGLGELVGSFCNHPAGPIVTGSPTVFVNSRLAARGEGDLVSCHDHGTKLLAEGSSTVKINSQPAARVGDRTACDAKIGSGSGNVVIGGASVQTHPIESEVPAWANWALVGLGVVGVIAMLAAPFIAASIVSYAPVAGIPAASDPNKFIHIFEDVEHNLAALVESFGSQEATFEAVQSATQKLATNGQIVDVFETVVRVGQYDVTVRGRVIDGLVRIGTFFIPP